MAGIVGVLDDQGGGKAGDLVAGQRDQPAGAADHGRSSLAIMPLIDPDGPAPVYLQVADVLRARIESGSWSRTADAERS